MKNIETMLSEIGITIQEDKRAAFAKDFAANYKTVAEYEKLKGKHDGLEQSLADVQGKLKAFGEMTAEEWKQKVSKLEGDLANEKAARQKDAAAALLKHRVDGFLADKHFVNDITRDAIAGKLAESLGSDDAKGKAIDDLFQALVTDVDGKELPGILTADPANAARFSAQKAPGMPGQPSEAEYLAAKYKGNPFFKG